MKYKLLVYIPSYNRFEKVFNQLNFLKQELTEDICIIVSNNNSDDQRYSDLKSSFPEENVLFFSNAINLGIVGNIMKGFSFNISEYLWILSDDEILNKGILIKILDEIGLGADHIYLESKIKGEESIKNISSVSGATNILKKFTSSSMTGLISANIYNLNLMNNYVSFGYNYGNTLFPHSAIFYAYLADNDHFEIKIIKDSMAWHFGEITYPTIHDNSWRYYLDLADIFTGKKKKIFVSQYIKDWGVGHYLKILRRDNNLIRFWFYSFKSIDLFPLFLKAYIQDLYTTYLKNNLKKVIRKLKKIYFKLENK